ncbi:hypothetical protein BDN72DRAFT_964753 [Pluteus cervinus]|uniref:Uncharacterized protein n=1 Tax=Pluteus cervinus TaxID=181527 RepID=A0ACD3A8C9_9AGAR|nr:hypothetical protein BDN72DRAFT_964753 [Pluteus cervinus]
MAPATIDDTLKQHTIHDDPERSRSIGRASKLETAYDHRVEDITERLAFVNKIYDENKDTIGATAAGFESLTCGRESLHGAATKFFETADVIIRGLDELAKVHPVIAIAVGAFKLVITLDKTRRQNNEKVLALKFEMQDMMAMFFELRGIEDLEKINSDGSQRGVRIKEVIEKIRADIVEASSACDAYLKKRFLERTLKSPIYERRFADYGAKFAQNKIDFQQALALQTAIGVATVEVKVEQLLQGFQKLNSDQENILRYLLNEGGGPEACIQDDEHLDLLLRNSGETLPDRYEGAPWAEALKNRRKVLLNEWNEDINNMFEDHLIIFRGKLDMQSQQLETIEALNTQIINLLKSGSHEKIVDPSLRMIWRDMGWRGSVKARHLVHALHDYYGDVSVLQGHERSTTEGAFPTLLPEDRWALAYVNIAHAQHIIEAVDDDGTQFVSIKEVNLFVTSSPQGWTLPRRLAYWAAGWRRSVLSYKCKIYTQVQKIYGLLDHLIPANRTLVEAYLESDPLIGLEHILLSIQVEQSLRDDPNLAHLVDMFETAEEVRLRQNLESVKYEVDSVETVGLITGPGRIERYLLPLVHLLLERDLDIMMLACKYVLSEQELLVGLRSLQSIFGAIDERVERITGVFRQSDPDVNARLSVFAFGMFLIYYDKVYRSDHMNVLNRGSNWFLTWSSAGSDLKAEVEKIPITKLKFGPLNLTAFQVGFMDPPSPFDIEETLPHEDQPWGHWSGHIWQDKVSFMGLMELRIDASQVPKKPMTGVGQNWMGSFSLEGEMGDSNRMTLYIKTDNGFLISCSATLDPINQILYGPCRLRNAYTGVTQDGFLLLVRTLTRLHRFRVKPWEFAENPSRGRWTFACNAILHEVRRKSWSWVHLTSQISDIKRFVSLHTRRLMYHMQLDPDSGLSDHEMREMHALRQVFDVSVAKLCYALARFHVDRLVARHRGIRCGACRRLMYGPRTICLDCLQENFVATIDLCRVCLTAPVVQKNLRHDSSHTMVRYHHTVFDYYKVLSSCTIADRAKAVLRATVDQEEGVAILCIHCSRTVTVPCWAHMDCVPGLEAFTCLDCEETTLPSQDNPTLIRIGTTDLGTTDLSTTDLSTTDLGPRVAAVKTNEGAPIYALERKVEERLTQLETIVQEQMAQMGAMTANVDERLTVLETRMEEQFSTLEGRLFQLMARGKAVPTSCSYFSVGFIFVIFLSVIIHSSFYFLPIDPVSYTTRWIVWLTT